MYKVRTLPQNMGYKECVALVWAAYYYFNQKKGIGESVAYIWKMGEALENSIRSMNTIPDVVNEIVKYQESQNWE